MNFKFNFENIQFDKKVKPITIGIIVTLVIVFSIISVGLFNNYSASNIKDSEQKAELISMNVSKDLEETVKSISYLSELISSNNLKAKITSEEVTTLLNSLISSDEKIFGAFVLLDKSEYEDLEDLNITNVEELEEESEEDEGDEDSEDEEDEDEEPEEEKEEVKAEIKTSVVNGLNKLIFRSGEGTTETTLDRINNLEYKKNYLKVLLSKEAQTMLPQVNSYDGIEKKTITYTMPIIVDGFVEGVIGLDIDTDKLNEELNSSADVLEGTYILLSKDNKVIVSNKDEYIGQSIDEIYGSRKLKKFFEESLESMELSSMKNKTASWLEDNLYITVPVVVNSQHIWNLVVKTVAEKTVTNAVVIIFLAIIFNVFAFGLLLFLVYTVFAKSFKKKFNGILDDLEVELSNIKNKKIEIIKDIDAIEEVEVEEYDDDEDEAIIEQFEATPEEAEEKAKETAKEDAELNALAASMDFDKYEEPKIEEPKEPEKPEGVELDGLNLDDVTKMVDDSVNETYKNEGLPIVDDDGSDEAPAIEQIIQAEEPKTEEEKPEEENKEEPKAEGEEPKAEGDETPEEPQLTPEEKAAQEAEIKKQEELEKDLAEVTENKDGAIENDDILAEMEAKMDAAMAKENTEESIPIIDEPTFEEPKIEEPVIEEPKIEEPKIEEPKIEEPKIEEPKIEEPKVEEPKVEEPKIEEPKIEEPVIEEPKIEEPKIEEPKIEEPKVEEPKIEPPKPAPAPAPAPAPKAPEPHKPHRIEDPEPLKKRSADDDDDPYSIRRGPKKLTNKEMDELLKELEAKRAAEDAENAGGDEEFTNETTIDSDLMSDLVGKIKGDDGL